MVNLKYLQCLIKVGLIQGITEIEIDEEIVSICNVLLSMIQLIKE